MLGSPIAHSLSPVLHLAAYRDLGLDDWGYDAIECGEPELAGTLRRLDAEGLAGVSLTMPLKRAVLPHLLRTDRLAADVEAANTVVFGGLAGEWWGANTDVPGIAAALTAATGSLKPAWGSVTLLGAGATAASVVAALAQLGVAHVSVVARRPEAVVALAAVAARFSVTIDAAPPEADELARRLAGADLVMSTVPAEASAAMAATLPAAVRGLLFDVVYAGWPTPLARAWEAAGGRVLGGLELLVQQAAIQVALMTGHQPDVAAMRVAGERALAAGGRGVR